MLIIFIDFKINNINFIRAMLKRDAKKSDERGYAL